MHQQTGRLACVWCSCRPLTSLKFHLLGVFVVAQLLRKMATWSASVDDAAAESSKRTLYLTLSASGIGGGTAEMYRGKFAAMRSVAAML